MKKLLAVLISVVMMLSVAILPAYAADDAIIEDVTAAGSVEDFRDGAEDVYNKVVEGDYFGAMDGAIALIEEFANAIHSLVGNIMAALGKECALCGAAHGEEVAPDDAVVTF